MNKTIPFTNTLFRFVSATVFLIFFTISPLKASEFDLDNGNAATDIIIPTLIPVIYQHVSPTAGDATLVLRITTLVTNAWFDASAPYHPTAVGVYSRLGRRPAAEATNRNINTAILYASYRVLNNLLPEFSQNWRDMMTDAGLDPNDSSTNVTTGIGLGNVAGIAVAKGRQNDGMNQLGNKARKNNPIPYSDYTGYKPVNTAHELRNPSRWQPDIQRQGLGLYKAQQFVTPQYALVEPYAYDDPQQFHLPPPFRSNYNNYRAYRKQADEVLQASADLTAERKLKAELFDNKINSLGLSAVHAASSQNLSLMEFIQLDFLANMAAFDAGIFVWQEKRQYDTVRPFSAIRALYNNHPVTAWGGPGRGTIQLPANEWKSYIKVSDHPEYPSASTCFCYAHSQAARNFLGSDKLFYQVQYPAGSSRIEPGITPAKDIALVFDTWTDFASDCGQSRIWAGVHFQAAIDAGAAACPVFGDLAYDYLSRLIDGRAALRSPSQGLR